MFVHYKYEKVPSLSRGTKDGAPEILRGYGGGHWAPERVVSRDMNPGRELKEKAVMPSQHDEADKMIRASGLREQSLFVSREGGFSHGDWSDSAKRPADCNESWLEGSCERLVSAMAGRAATVAVSIVGCGSVQCDRASEYACSRLSARES